MATLKCVHLLMWIKSYKMFMLKFHYSIYLPQVYRHFKTINKCVIQLTLPNISRHKYLCTLNLSENGWHLVGIASHLHFGIFLWFIDLYFYIIILLLWHCISNLCVCGWWIKGTPRSYNRIKKKLNHKMKCLKPK